MVERPEQQNIIQKIARATATLFLGVVIPLVLMFQAYTALHEMSISFQNFEDTNSVTENFLKIKKVLSSENDYLLYTKLHAEHIAYKLTINKQIMKVAVMNIGFAVASVGIMFILLGFKETGANSEQSENGVAIAGEAGGVKFDLKTGSTGLAIFVLGALMASGAGIISNVYRAGGIPSYANESDNGLLQNSTETQETGLTTREQTAINDYKICKTTKVDLEFGRCFINHFYDTYEKEIKK